MSWLSRFCLQFFSFLVMVALSITSPVRAANNSEELEKLECFLAAQKITHTKIQIVFKKVGQTKPIPGSYRYWSESLKKNIDEIYRVPETRVSVGGHAVLWTRNLRKHNLVFVRADTARELGHILIRPSQLYESPNPDFRVGLNAEFKRRDLKAWFSENRFFFGRFWDGFAGYNISHEAFRELDSDVFSFLSYEETELLKRLKESLVWNSQFYLVGFTDPQENLNVLEVLLHELGHAFYWGDSEYRTIVNSIVAQNLSSKIISKIKKHLMKGPYASDVLDDEVHAYVLAGPSLGLFLNPIELGRVTRTRKKLLKFFDEYLRKSDAVD